MLTFLVVMSCRNGVEGYVPHPAGPVHGAPDWIGQSRVHHTSRPDAGQRPAQFGPKYGVPTGVRGATRIRGKAKARSPMLRPDTGLVAMQRTGKGPQLRGCQGLDHVAQIGPGQTVQDHDRVGHVPQRQISVQPLRQRHAQRPEAIG